MTEIDESKAVAPSQTERGSEDLSEVIRQSVDRRLGEEVRCVRVYGNHYRCNWWVRAAGEDVSPIAGRIGRSKFLKVLQTPDGLVIEDLTRAN